MFINFRENLKLSTKELIKLKSLKLVDIPDNMNYFKWSKMRVFMPCALNSQIL